MSSVAVASEALAPGPLKYQTWMLKVPIHCEGCRRKVKKVLHSIDGVFTTTIDPQQHKVVVMGDVDTDTLIKKLIKSGKQAEVWPEPVENTPVPNENQNDNNGTVNEGDDTSDVDEMGGEVKTAISTEGGEPTGGKKKKKKKKKKKNKGNPDLGALAPTMATLNPEPAAPDLGSTDLVSQPYQDFRTYQVIDYFPREYGTSYDSVYAHPNSSSYMYQPPVNAYSYSSGSEMIATIQRHLHPPTSDPIRNQEDDYYHDYDDEYNVGCSVM
ncbi:hypothetical protein MLD38_026386 [Melastoma candidum]|uniref:Uncharacterized protein n=1 Tax=Melastoma candidum TaxID=119954 RepID=A0ACB9NYX2_9MYRT|nr:hypothetical protein MLD38_026386 [Melastoma candidum]